MDLGEVIVGLRIATEDAVMVMVAGLQDSSVAILEIIGKWEYINAVFEKWLKEKREFV